MKTEKQILEVIQVKNKPCLKISAEGKSPRLFLEWLMHNQKDVVIEIVENGFDEFETFFVIDVIENVVADVPDDVFLKDCFNYINANL